MKIEVDSLKEKMTERSTKIISGIEFNVGLLYDTKVVVAVSGIGKVNAAICAQTMILKFGVDCIINTGIAAGIYKSINIGDIVIGTSVVQHDMDTTAFGDPIGFISGEGHNLVNVPLTQSVGDKIAAIAEGIDNIKVYRGTVATGDQFLTDPKKNLWLAETFDAYAADIESASIGIVCYVNDIDCSIIRSVSDGGNDDAVLDYPTFSKLAAKNAAYLLEQFIKTNNTSN